MEYGQRLAVTLRLMSCKKIIDVQTFKRFCIDTNVFLLNNLPWVSITPTLHKVLCHAWELIEQNDGKGLGDLDESGLEGNNKILRKIRQDLARKTNQSNNIEYNIVRI